MNEQYLYRKQRYASYLEGKITYTELVNAENFIKELENDVKCGSENNDSYLMSNVLLKIFISDDFKNEDKQIKEKMFDLYNSLLNEVVSEEKHLFQKYADEVRNENIKEFNGRKGSLEIKNKCEKILNSKYNFDSLYFGNLISKDIKFLMDNQISYDVSILVCRRVIDTCELFYYLYSIVPGSVRDIISILENYKQFEWNVYQYNEFKNRTNIINIYNCIFKIEKIINKEQAKELNLSELLCKIKNKILSPTDDSKLKMDDLKIIDIINVKYIDILGKNKKFTKLPYYNKVGNHKGYIDCITKNKKKNKSLEMSSRNLLHFKTRDKICKEVHLSLRREMNIFIHSNFVYYESLSVHKDIERIVMYTLEIVEFIIEEINKEKDEE